jgi:hypothetical protein
MVGFASDWSRGANRWRFRTSPCQWPAEEASDPKFVAPPTGRYSNYSGPKAGNFAALTGEPANSELLRILSSLLPE